MKKLVLIIIAVVITMVSCKNDSKSGIQIAVEKESALEEMPKAILHRGCYEYDENGNYIQLEITEVNPKVIGSLKIAYAEKDRNQGTFIGNLNDNKLIGIYSFFSEGTQSSREMAFLVKNGQLLEGYGELNEDGTKFKDSSAISYTANMPLTAVDCDK